MSKPLLWFWIPLVLYPICYVLMSVCVGVFIAQQSYLPLIFPIAFFALTARHFVLILCITMGILLKTG